MWLFCRLPWDTWSAQSHPVCKTLEQFLAHERKYYQLVDIVGTELVSLTGCLIPCTYNQYKLADKAKKISALDFILLFRFARNEVLEEKEAYVYGFVSFVSEFGGSLGLFLGFSFMMVWEAMEPIFLVFQKQLKSSQKVGKT